MADDIEFAPEWEVFYGLASHGIVQAWTRTDAFIAALAQFNVNTLEWDKLHVKRF